MEACLFCTQEYRENSHLEDDLFFVVFDAYPVSPGHMLVIPKRHVLGFLDLHRQEWEGLQSTITAAVSALAATDLLAVYERMMQSQISDNSIAYCKAALKHPKIGMKPDAFNHGINDGIAAGRTVHHLHWHIIPRYAGDVLDPRGGVRYVIPENGNYKVPKH